MTFSVLIAAPHSLFSRSAIVETGHHSVGLASPPCQVVCLCGLAVCDHDFVLVPECLLGCSRPFSLAMGSSLVRRGIHGLVVHNDKQSWRVVAVDVEGIRHQGARNSMGRPMVCADKPHPWLY